MPATTPETRPGSIDAAVAVDEEGVFLSGWLSGVGAGDQVRLVSAKGGAAPLDLAYRFERPDVVARLPHSAEGELHGFAALAQLPSGPLQRGGLRLEIGPGDGLATALDVPVASADPVEARRRVLTTLELGSPGSEFLSRHAYPAIERLRGRIAAELGVRSVIDQGRVPSNPEVSILIPTYGRLDLLTPQVALLADDPEIREAELVIVLDSPELEDRLVELTYHLERLYRLPMRLVTMNRNAGFGYANNVGAQHAGGSLLLLLNSDVFPRRPGWLSALVDAHRADDVAATGAKLLYEDSSLQHAGMYFERDGVTGQWQNLHFHKGMPGTLPAANQPRRVPALTAACMLVGRDEFNGVGGFDPAYVLGDYEDSDLCLRLQESGRQCRYVPAAELYHLERQSFEDGAGKAAGAGRVIYNRWLFGHKWNQRIAEVMEEFGASSAHGQANGEAGP